MWQEADLQWSKLKAAIDSSQVTWTNVELNPENPGKAYKGVCADCTVDVIGWNVEGRGLCFIALMNPVKSMFHVIRLTNDKASYCFRAAHGKEN